MNLLFAINRNFTGYLCKTLHSIAKNGNASHYEAYILHSDLTTEDQEIIQCTADEQISCHFIFVDEQIFQGFPENQRYPKQIYYRLAAPLLLPEKLDKILYLDVDLVVINSLQELYNTDFDGNYYIACSHTDEFLTKFNQLRLGVDANVPYINTGVMMMNLPLLRRDLNIDRIRTAAKNKMHCFLLPDQDLLTLMHGEHIKLVDTMRYNLSDRLLSFHNMDPRKEKLDLEWVRKNAVIIHYFGKNKPWKEHYRGILDVLYHENTGKTE